MALPLILQKSRRFVPPSHHRNFKYQTQLGGKYTVKKPHFLKHQQCWFSMIQYPHLTQSSSQRFTALAEERWCHFPSWILDSSLGRSPNARSGHTCELGDEGAVFNWGSKVRLPTRAPIGPHDFCWEFGGRSFGNPAWNSAVKRIYFRKKYSNLIHEWEVSTGRLRSLTINFWLSQGHPSGFGSRKIIFPHQKLDRKEPSDFESSQNFIIQKFPPNDRTVMILMMTLDVSADWESWGSVSRGYRSFQQTFPYWEGGNTMRSRKTHSMHFSNKNRTYSMPQAGSPSTNGVAAPTAAKAPQNRTKPLHFCMASVLVLLDLRALFILITIHPWCFPSFLRSGKTPTKIVWSWGTPTKGDSFGETLGDWPPEFWAIFVFQLGISFRIKPSTFSPSLCDNGTINFNGCCDINLLDDVTCVDQVGWYDFNTSS